MRKLALGLALTLFAVPLVALAGGGLPLDTAVRAEFTDCSSSGSSATTLAVGDYLFRVTDADVWICFASSASTCASNGEKFPLGTVINLTIRSDQVSVSCRSAASNGDAIFTRTN